MTTFTVTHKGKRKENQDVVLINAVNATHTLYLIADGMGGYERGAQAAKIVAESISVHLSTLKDIDSKDIQKAVNKANLAIRQAKQDTHEKMGATIGGVILSGDKALCFWVGDVKIFHFRDKTLCFETSPHTLMNEIKSNGSITDVEQLSKYKHVVTRSVQGDIALSEIDYVELEDLTDKDVLVICSDGVHDILNGRDMAQILGVTENFEAALNIIEKRLLEDAQDNFSLIAIDF
jgi:serine/threonine protein phosphatase PrpC